MRVSPKSESKPPDPEDLKKEAVAKFCANAEDMAQKIETKVSKKAINRVPDGPTDLARKYTT